MLGQCYWLELSTNLQPLPFPTSSINKHTSHSPPSQPSQLLPFDVGRRESSTRAIPDPEAAKLRVGADWRTEIKT